MERLVFNTAVSPYWLGCVADNADDSAKSEFLGSLESWLSMSVPSISTKKLEQVKWVIIYIFLMHSFFSVNILRRSIIPLIYDVIVFICDVGNCVRFYVIMLWF